MEENKNGLEDISQALKEIYDTIPATNGCMDHINKPSDEGGCNAWCCRVQNPQVLYCEFINSWNTMKQKFGAETMLSVVRSAIVNYLDNGVQKGCIFFDKDTNHCIQHKTRPLACRTYGIMPEEEWKPRIERLKVLHPDQPWKDQCNLVTTKNGQVVTKADTDNWFKKIVDVEKSLGVPENKINDSPSGTYRTYHDHVMLMFYGNKKEILVDLSKMRVHADQQTKDALVDTVIAQLRKSSEGGNQGNSKATDNTGEKEVSGDATGGTP